MKLIRKGDILWLRLAALSDPDFGEGVPVRLCPTRFAALAEAGLVEHRDNGGGSPRAVATERGRKFVENRRTRMRRWITGATAGEEANA